MPAVAKRAPVTANKPAGQQIQMRKISELVPYERNARTHSEEQIAQVAASIREFGWTNPILLDGESGVIAGHARLAAARLLDLKQVPCIELAHLTDAQKRAYILADNKLALNAGWDLSLLAGELQDLKGLDFDLSLLGFGEQDLTELLAYSPGTEGLTDPDECPEVPENPVTKPGDLWILGKHRLLCGDATKAPDVEQLMAGEKADMVFTDPPYGIGYLPDSKLKKLGRLENDHRSGRWQNFDEFSAFLATAVNALLSAMKEGACYYVCMGWEHLPDIMAGFAKRNSKTYSVIVWDRLTPRITSYPQDYIPVCEFIAYGWKRGRNRQRTSAGDQQTTIWRFKTEKSADMKHPTQKPVAVVVNAILNSSLESHLVLDLFGGSGSTLIACEKTGRGCCGMELSPPYCDVIITRWQNFTGQEAILHGTKKTFAQISKKQAA